MCIYILYPCLSISTDMYYSTYTTHYIHYIHTHVHIHTYTHAYICRLLVLLSSLIHPKRVLEIGTFTGYTTLSLAEGMAEGLDMGLGDSKDRPLIITCDINKGSSSNTNTTGNSNATATPTPTVCVSQSDVAKKNFKDCRHNVQVCMCR